MPVPQNPPDAGFNHLRVPVCVIFRRFSPGSCQREREREATKQQVLPKLCKAGAKVPSGTATVLNGTWKGGWRRAALRDVVYIPAVHLAARRQRRAHAVSMRLCQEKVPPHHICRVWCILEKYGFFFVFFFSGSNGLLATLQLPVAPTLF